MDSNILSIFQNSHDSSKLIALLKEKTPLDLLGELLEKPIIVGRLRTPAMKKNVCYLSVPRSKIESFKLKDGEYMAILLKVDKKEE